jgi:hypothetical protein
LASAAALLAALAATAGPATHAAPAAQPAAPPDSATASTTLGPQLVLGGGFETGLQDWRTNDAAQILRTRSPGQDSTSAAILSRRDAGDVVLNDEVNTVSSSPKGTAYSSSVWVRAVGSRLTGSLRLRETTNGTLRANGETKFIARKDVWTRIDLDFTTTTAGSELDLNVLAWKVPAESAFLVDRVSLRVTAPGPGPGPGPGGPSCIGNVMGIPQAGQGSLFGAVVNGTSSLATREAQVGTLGLERTYYQGNQVDSAIRTVRDDHADGRLPWISFKLPYSWTEMANGRGDAWALDLARKLDATSGPVWLAFHHEPENDGDISEWTRMQQRLAPIIHANSDNVAVSIVVTGWNQFYGPKQFSLASIWPGDRHVDIVGLDPYNWYGSVENGVVEKDWSELKPYYEKMAPFARAHGVEWAIAETGYTHEAAARDPKWLARAYNDMVTAGGIGMSYFDSSYNTLGGSWNLDPTAKHNAFGNVLERSTRIC